MFHIHIRKPKTILRPRSCVLAGLFILMILLNVVSWNSSTFSDWYIAHIFPLWTNTYCRFTALFPFSVGELLIYLAIILLICGVLILGLGFIHSSKLKNLRRTYWYILCWITVIVLLIQTLNCFIQYHASSFESQYFSNEKELGFDDLTSLREHIVSKLNTMSADFDRNDNGEIIYTGDIYAKCIQAMKHLGKEYPNLAGYSPEPKKILSSDFMSQQYLAGIYFPFTLEANYNSDMYITNMPFTICHELAHLKGYIYEDEANFIGFMACIESDDEFLQYCGYLNVVGYVGNEYHKNADDDTWNNRTLINELVASDDIFLTDYMWDKINKTALFSTDSVETISNNVMDSSLKLNGVKDGMDSYSRVVQLLLLYGQRSGWLG